MALYIINGGVVSSVLSFNLKLDVALYDTSLYMVISDDSVFWDEIFIDYFKCISGIGREYVGWR
jgi:hypothetical protein